MRVKRWPGKRRLHPAAEFEAWSMVFACGTDYFGAKYNMWQMDPSGALQKRMRFEGYRSGHMMYLHYPSLMKLKSDLANFYAGK